MFYLVFKDGSELGPLVCDNPKSVYGFSDRSILRKANKLAKKLSKSTSEIVTVREDV